jgi:hypothetical protein
MQEKNRTEQSIQNTLAQQGKPKVQSAKTTIKGGKNFMHSSTLKEIKETQTMNIQQSQTINPQGKHRRNKSTSGSLKVNQKEELKIDEKEEISEAESFLPKPLLEPQNNSDPVFSCLKQSLKIMEKIQKDFEISAINNNKQSNMNDFISKMTFDQLLLSNYSGLSNRDKASISGQISQCSDQRIKNYSNLFSVINSSLEDIKECLIQYNKGKYSV